MLNDDYNDRMAAIDPVTGALVWQYGLTGEAGTASGLLNTPDGFDVLGPAVPPRPTPPGGDQGDNKQEVPSRLAEKVVAYSAAVATVAAGLAMAAPKTSIVATLTPWKFPAPVYRTVAVVSSGRIFVLGGHDAAGATTTSVFEFNPASGKSVLAGTLALPTHGAAAARVAGRVMVFGERRSRCTTQSSSSTPLTGNRRLSDTCPRSGPIPLPPRPGN